MSVTGMQHPGLLWSWAVFGVSFVDGEFLFLQFGISETDDWHLLKFPALVGGF